MTGPRAEPCCEGGAPASLGLGLGLGLGKGGKRGVDARGSARATPAEPLEPVKAGKWRKAGALHSTMAPTMTA